MKRKMILLSMLLSLMTFFASTSGVFATWKYVENSSFPVNQSHNITMSEFIYMPEEILPSVTPGQNYLDLHASILENDKAGLNSSKGTLEKALANDGDGFLQSSQNIQGGNLKHLFVTEASKELDFIAQYVSENEIIVYMYKSSDAEESTIGVTKIQVYKTIYIKTDNTWAGKETHLGTATVQFFINTSIVAIDVGSWTHSL